MDRWVGRVALVTGASSGIGAAICKQLVDAGMIVIGAARGVDRIKALAKDLQGKKGTLDGVKCDLTKDADIENLFSFIKENYKGVDVCINNAGMSHNHSLLEGTTKEWREMLDINVVGLCLCTKLAVKSMQERGVDDGHIIHVSSVRGHQVFEFDATHFYMSTKFAVRALTEGLRQELRGLKSNIRISSISPGGVDTEFGPRMLGGGIVDEETAKEFSKNIKTVSGDDVASSVTHMLAAPPHVQIHDLIIRPTCDPY